MKNKYTVRHSDVSDDRLIIESNDNNAYLNNLLSEEIVFLKELVKYANLGADMEASAREEIDTSDINNFIE